MEAGDLLDVFEKQNSQPYSERRAAEIMRQVGSAVQYLHSLGIAHRQAHLQHPSILNMNAVAETLN